MKIIFIGLCLFAASAQAQLANPAVTQANIAKTICVKGWTATVRPSVSYTSRIKRQMCVAQGVKTCSADILDHIIPIEVGGSPDNAKNFQLQTKADAAVKDQRENQARQDVCTHRVTLAQAQARFKR